MQDGFTAKPAYITTSGGTTTVPVSQFYTVPIIDNPLEYGDFRYCRDADVNVLGSGTVSIRFEIWAGIRADFATTSLGHIVSRTLTIG